ncbi:MAG: hypothetical protein KKF48_02220 [Nanoarchaeota archaeon]|nr:hypothetical protein [Nanoarchaeota archaeon]MBU1027835.1 hypothetical protein [Nanoarchaeota archaeon]
MVLNNKSRLSVSVSTETIALIEESLKLEKFRNKSHIVEFSINKVLKDQFIKSNKGAEENGN